MIQLLDLRIASYRRRFRSALDQCRDARAYARASDHDAWEYAVEMESLVKAGLTPSDLRWMVSQGHLRHAIEVTLLEDSQRRFLPGRNLAFPPGTCFVLSAAGEMLADSLDDNDAILPLVAEKLSARVNPPLLQPNWDSESRVLTLCDQLVKRYRVPSPTQELILKVFQEEGWPSHIIDPLPPDPAAHPKTRVHDAIKCLNRNQRLHLIQFCGDGTGEGILWELTRQGSLLAQPGRGKNRGDGRGRRRVRPAA
jgi:hypothetical protein